MKIRQMITTAVCTIALVLGFGMVAATTATAHDPDHFVCVGNVQPWAPVHSVLGDPTVDGFLWPGEHFAGHQTVVYGGQFWTRGHTAFSYPTDYWVRTNYLRC